MKIKKNKIRRKISSGLIKMFNFIENNNNSIFFKNGEAKFIEDISNYYLQQKKIVIFDVGANIGEYSTMIEKKVGSKAEIHIFEPQSMCIDEMSKIFKNKSNIIINNFGLSSSNKESFIYKDSEKSTLASLYKRKLKKIELDKKEQVILKSANNYIINNNIKKINILKIDVEGHELEVLKGFSNFLTPNFIDFIQFEYGGTNMDAKTNLKEIYLFLEKAGFIIAKIMPNYLEERVYLKYMDNFMYSNYVAYNPKIKYEKDYHIKK